MCKRAISSDKYCNQGTITVTVYTRFGLASFGVRTDLEELAGSVTASWLGPV